MNNPTATKRTPGRLTTIAAALAITATAGRIAVEVARRLVATAEQRDRAARELTRTVGQLSMIARHDDELDAEIAAEIRAIRTFNSRIAAALDDNNARWEKRQAEVYQTGYMDGMKRRGPEDPPMLHSV